MIELTDSAKEQIDEYFNGKETPKKYDPTLPSSIGFFCSTFFQQTWVFARHNRRKRNGLTFIQESSSLMEEGTTQWPRRQSNQQH